MSLLVTSEVKTFITWILASTSEFFCIPHLEQSNRKRHSCKSYARVPCMLLQRGHSTQINFPDNWSLAILWCQPCEGEFFWGRTACLFALWTRLHGTKLNFSATKLSSHKLIMPSGCHKVCWACASYTDDLRWTCFWALDLLFKNVVDILLHHPCYHLLPVTAHLTCWKTLAGESYNQNCVQIFCLRTLL